MNQFFIKFVAFILIVLTAQETSATADKPTSSVFPKLTVEDFIAEPDLRDAEISPNGRYLAIILTKDKARFIVIKDLEAEGMPTIGTLGDITFRPDQVKWANNERLLVQLRVPLNPKRVKRDHKSEEDFDIYSYAMTNRLVSVNVNAKDLVVMMDWKIGSHVSHYLSGDPEHVLMPYKYQSRYSLDKVNVYTGKSELHFRARNYKTHKVFTDDKGKLLYRLDYLDLANETVIFKYTDDEDWEEIDKIKYDEIDKDADDYDPKLIYFGLSQDSSMAFKQINKLTGFYEIVEINKKDKTRKVIASMPDQDIVSLITENRSDNIIGFTTQKDLVRNHYFDKVKQQQYDDATSKIGNNNLTFYWPVGNSTKAIAFISGPDNPGSYSLFDTKTNKLDLIGKQYSKLKLEDLGIPAVTNLKMRDGGEIRAYILFPPNYQEGKPMPMVVLPHGGPHYRDSAGYNFLAQFIATRGYIVVQPNFRGSTGYGLEFLSAGFKQWGGLMQDDITDTVKFMIDEGYALKDKICIVGASYGGYAALMGVIKTPDLYQCSISINGVTNIEEQIAYVIKTSSRKKRDEITDLLHKRIGNPETEINLLRVNSPALRADEVKTPVLIVVGLDDKIVLHSQSKQMTSALKDADKEVDTLLLKRASHNIFYYIDQKEEALKKIEEFLAKYLSDSLPVEKES